MERERSAALGSAPHGMRLGGAYIDTEAPAEQAKPNGPFTQPEQARAGELILFVPRNEISRMIDRLTGGYGYSHLAVDCGESDQRTGRPVMIEATVGAGVHYSFQDEYGRRAFVRIPLRDIGVDVNQFGACVRSKVGEKFDDVEAISLGILDNPARQICSDLATGCLPEDLRQEIARCHKRAVIHPLSAARNERSSSRFRLFMSPNGFAEFLGAPRGSSLKGPERAVPHVQCGRERVGMPERLWKRIDAFLRRAMSRTGRD